MKKLYFCLVCTIFLTSLVQGQYYRQDRGVLLGVNAGYLYPTGDMGKLIKNGIEEGDTVRILDFEFEWTR